jgi:hypothetical protein
MPPFCSKSIVVYEGEVRWFGWLQDTVRLVALRQRGPRSSVAFELIDDAVEIESNEFIHILWVL